MDAVKELLSNKLAVIPSQFIPFVSIGMVVVAVLLVVIFFGICVIYVNSKPKPIVRRDASKDVAGKEKAPQKIRHEDLPILSGRLGEILSMYGFLNAGPITKIFFQVLEIIKNSTYDLRWRYKLPCFMIVGSEKSGKTTLLNSLNLEHLTADGSAIDSMWKLFKKGAIFELPKTEMKEDESKFWSFISELFMFIRPRRPLDGIIVALPADMLLTNSAIEKHAVEMFNKIFTFQHEINFRLPIYLIITKSDLITGFSEFSHLLHESSKQQMFGWSCPYALNSAFSMAWADEAFQTIDEGIRKATVHLAQEKRISEDLEKAILFESEINKTKKALTAYLNAMFRSHNPEEGLILRGIYFVGQQKAIEEASAELLQPNALSPQLLTTVNYSGVYNNELYFVQDLFTEKIFKEYNLAYPINLNAVDMGQVSFRNKLILTGTVITFSLGWFFGNNNIKNKIHEYYGTLA
ncbi:MAG: hypothetical protein K6C34_04825, partial [Alphaproteobacteria bacterium]|nr:hypothetical protein [Alphaproteobacteria bacterium]